MEGGLGIFLMEKNARALTSDALSATRINGFLVLLFASQFRRREPVTNRAMDHLRTESVPHGMFHHFTLSRTLILEEYLDMHRQKLF